LRLAGLAGVAAGCASGAAARRGAAEPGSSGDQTAPQDRATRTVRSVCRECPAGCGITVYLLRGRVVALAGNPEDPVSGGVLCARGLASAQRLASPDRFQGPLERRADGSLGPLPWAAAERRLARALQAARSAGPGAILLVTRPEPTSLGALQRAFVRALGAGDEARIVLDPFDALPLRAANEALLGLRELPAYRLSAARTVVAFGADFQETWLSPAELAGGLAAGRARPGEARTRLIWVGPRRAGAGATADLWVRCRAGEEPAVALCLLRWLVDPSHGVSDLAPVSAELWPRLRRLAPEDLALRAGVSQAQLQSLAGELARSRPSALLGPGTSSQGPDATQLAALLVLLDVILGNVGETVFHGLDAGEDQASPYADVAEVMRDLSRGRVQVLLVQRADPVGTLPEALRASEALRRVPLVVSFAERPDATTSLAQLVLPDRHTLESFVDVVPRAGVVNLGVPAVPPLGDTRSTAQVLLEVANLLPYPAAHFPWADPSGYWEGRLQKYAMAVTGEMPEPAMLAAAVRRGGLWGPMAPPPVVLRSGAAGTFLEPPPARPTSSGGLDLVPFPAGLPGQVGGEPSHACLELSPATAGRLGVVSGQLVGVATSSGRTTLPVLINPDLRDDAAGVPVGPPETLALLAGDPEGQSGSQRFLGEVAVVTR
jgi:molybdopterin-containing oxidoreductase family iron-sulfur binding subunit